MHKQTPNSGDRFRANRVPILGALAAAVFLLGLFRPSFGNDDEPPFGDAGKFGQCEDPDPQEQEKCEAETGNCLEYTMGEAFTIGVCVTFSDVSWPPVALPNGWSAKSAKAIESRAYGACATGGTSDTCNKCGKYWCAKAKFWKGDGCPGDEASATFAIAKTDACDPNA